MAAAASEGWWEKDRQAQAQQPQALPQDQMQKQADSRVMSDEEVEEAEAADAFPALGYPHALGSVCSGQQA